MIQFNLLPDVKLDYIKARRTKRLVLTIATLGAGFFLFILVVLFMVVNVFQKQHLRDVNTDIGKYTSQLTSNQELPKILTVQNQLKSLQEQPNFLLSSRPITSRLSQYITQVVPNKISISQMTVDFDLHTIVITGEAKTINDINQFVDTLKFTNFSTADSTTESKAFSGVVLSSFGREDDKSTYTINLNFDQAIFDGSKQPKLSVPSIKTTRSNLDEPLFSNLPKPPGNQ